MRTILSIMILASTLISCGLPTTQATSRIADGKEKSAVRTNNGSASEDLNVGAACAMARSNCWSNALADCNSIGYIDGEIRKTAVTSSGKNRRGAYCNVSCSYVCVK